MALKILETCINCAVCEMVCPNTAIFAGATIYHIDPHRCTECQGQFDQPQCQVVCPESCIITDDQSAS